MKLSLPVRKNLLMSALAIAMTLQAASASAEKVAHWDACKSIPRYPHALPGLYATDPIKPADQVPENLASQEVYDPLPTILAWYKKALPGWGFVEPQAGSWPLMWSFFKDGVIKRKVTILAGSPTSEVQFECWTVE